MNPYRAYQQQTSSHPTRIDMLLALYDATLSRLEGGRQALEQQDQATAKALLARAQVLVGGLAAGVDIGQGEIPLNFLRLYEFALYSIRLGTVEGIDGALRVLRTLQEALQAIRPEATKLEQQGQIPGINVTGALQATA